MTRRTWLLSSGAAAQAARAQDPAQSAIDQRNEQYARELESHFQEWLVDEYPARAAKAWNRSYANIEAFVDRAYSRDRADLRNTVNRLSEEISLLLDPNNVRETVAATLHREMVLKSAAVVSRDRTTRAYPLTLVGRIAGSEPSWALGATLLNALRDRRDPVSVRELYDLPENEAERTRLMAEMERLGVQTVFPMHAARQDGVAEIVRCP